MNPSLKVIAPLIAALAIAGCNGGSSPNLPSASGTSQTTASAKHLVPAWQAKHEARRACSELGNGLECQVLIATNGARPNCSPSKGSCGWRPIDFVTRYNLGSSEGNGTGQTVALIEAGDLPSAASDLTTYRSTFNLGAAPFAKYNQLGEQYNYPPGCAAYSWCLETDLDIEMVAAVCPNCTIDLIEGDGTTSGLEAAESEAVKLGATILSNSWGCDNVNCGDSNFPSYFSTRGIIYLASSGDSGDGEIAYPAALANVAAVGGTQLEKSGSTYSETVWNGAGGGCATKDHRPRWQYNPDCKTRSIADVSAEAGCSPSVAEYDTDYGGWTGVCGTSVASPLVAGMFALAGNATHQRGGKTFWKPKSHHNDLYTVCSSGSITCLFSTYSYGGGWGSPNGIGAL